MAMTIFNMEDHESDAELLSKARRGDRHAMSKLFSRHHRHALAHARTLRGADPEDVVAEAFANTWKHLRRGAGPDRNFRAYLLRAVHNAWVSDVRKRSRYLTTDDERVLDSAPRTADVSSELLDAAGNEFSKLPERERVVLWLTAVEGHSLAEAGKRLGTTQGAAGALVYRARKRLAAALRTQVVPGSAAA
jgi:RNA polymerase sigma factor (sigma-70 family)